MQTLQKITIFSILLVSFTTGMSLNQQNFLFGISRDSIRPMLKYREFNFNSRIVGGDVARRSQHPYQVATFNILPWGTGICGGVLLSTRVVITAAHCVESSSSTQVIMGAHFLFDGNEPDRVAMEVLRQSYIIHEKYDAQMLYNDVALLILPTAVKLTKSIQTIDLPSGDDLKSSYDGELATVSGWGRFSDDNSWVSDVLRFTVNEVKSNSACFDIFGNFVIDSTLCTITRATRSGTCHGDSGGPLTVTRNGKPVLIGVVSFVALAGCQLDYPTGFARVTYFYDWIVEHMRRYK